MRTLEYIVKGQRLLRAGDHGSLVAGTEGYLRAHFTFDESWDDCAKVVSFYNNDEEHAVILKDDACDIPKEALTGSSFKVAVEGRRKNYRILSTKITETQRVRRNN